MFWISQVTSSSVQYSELVPPLIVAGCGVSMALPATQSAGVGALPREAVGVASGVYSMMRQLGGLVGVAVMATVFAAADGYGSSSLSFTRALTACGLMSLLGALCGLGIGVRRSPGPKNRTGRPEQERVEEESR